MKRFTLGFVLLLATGFGARAAEVRLLSAEVMRHPIKELAADFEGATGHKLVVTYESAVKIRDMVKNGEAADVAIIQRPMVSDLAEKGKVVPASVVSLARSGLGVAIPKGAATIPDISSVEAFKRSLLAARSIGYPDPKRGAASGILFERDLERLGLAGRVHAKLKSASPSWSEFIAQNELDIVITQPMEILADPGLQFIGWLPDDLQDYNAFTWAAAITTNAREPEAGKAFIEFLLSPAATAVIKRKGMNPIAAFSATCATVRSRSSRPSCDLGSGGSQHQEFVTLYTRLPAVTTYHGYQVLELPPPSQNWATNEILNILEVCVSKWAPGQTLASLGPANPKYWHFLVEAKKLAYNDLFAYNADPSVVAVPLSRLLSKEHKPGRIAVSPTDKAKSTGAAHGSG